MEIIRILIESFVIGNADVLTADFGVTFSIVSAALAAAAAAAEAGVAAKQASDARRTEEKNRAEIEKEQRRRDNLFNRRYHQDMTENTEVQSMLRELGEQRDAQASLHEAQHATMGATSPQELADKNATNKMYAEGLAGMTRNASTLKYGLLDDYENDLGKYYQQRREENARLAQLQRERSNMSATAASNAMSAATGIGMVAAGALDNGVKAPQKAPAGGGGTQRVQQVLTEQNPYDVSQYPMRPLADTPATPPSNNLNLDDLLGSYKRKYSIKPLYFGRNGGQF